MCAGRLNVKLNEKIVLLLLAIIAVYSLFTGHFLSFFAQITPIVFNYAKASYPGNVLIRMADTPLSPVLRNGIMASEYSARMAMFASKWLFIFVVIFSFAITFELEIDSNPLLLGIFAFGLPLFVAMALVTIVFHSLKYFYIRVSGKDKIWVE